MKPTSNPPQATLDGERQSTLSEQFDLFSNTREMSGAGEFAEGTVTRVPDGFHVDAASVEGRRWGGVLDTVYVGYMDELDLEMYHELDLSGYEFRMGRGELHLRGRANE